VKPGRGHTHNRGTELPFVENPQNRLDKASTSVQTLAATKELINDGTTAPTVRPLRRYDRSEG